MTSIVTLGGWQEGLRKVSLTRLMRDDGGLGLASAKRAVDDLLSGEHVIVRLAATADADRVKAEMRKLGVIVR